MNPSFPRSRIGFSIAALLAVATPSVVVGAAGASAQPSPFRADRYYRLTTLWQGNCMSLDVVNDGATNRQLVLATTGNFSGQFWRLTPVGDGSYRLSTLWRGAQHPLEVDSGGGRVAPTLGEGRAGAIRRWSLALLGDGHWRIAPAQSGDARSLDIVNDGLGDNQPILADTADVSGQHWKIVEAHASDGDGCG